MSIFSGVKSEGLEKTEDRLGGFQLWETDAYDSTVKMAYAGQSAKGARFIYYAFDIGGKEYRETIYFTNQKGENFFLNQNDQTKKVPLPGFVVVNHIALVTTEQELENQNTEEKMVNVWDNDQKKELPKSVHVLVDQLGKPVTLGIIKQLVNKNEKQANGEYKPIADTREENVIQKVFDTNTRGTISEVENEKPLGEFYKAWVEKNQGKLIDNRKLKGPPSAGGNSGPPQAGEASAAPKKSLFGN